VTPNAIVKHRRIRIATSKSATTIASFLLFGALWLAAIDPSKNKTLFFLLLELFEIYLHFAL